MGGIGAERAPAPGRARVAAEAPEGTTHAEVRGKEDVRIAEGAHGHVVRGPGSDAGEGQKPRPRLLAVDARAQIEPAVRNRSGDGAERTRASARHRQAARVRGGELLARREMKHPAV